MLLTGTLICKVENELEWNMAVLQLFQLNIQHLQRNGMEVIDLNMCLENTCLF